MKTKTIVKTISFLIILSFFSFLSFKLGFLEGEKNILKTPPLQITDSEIEKPNSINFSIFWETWRQLERNYLEKENIDYQKMVYGAIEGMVNSVGDPYTTFFTPKEADSFTEELSGKYEGIGMVVGIKDDILTVVSPFQGTPAEEAGLKAGDAIVKVEDTFTQDLSIEEAVKLIKGPQGTKVKLLIQRDDWQEPKEFLVKRDVIKIPTLEKEIIDDQIALIKIYQFNRILSSEFQKAGLEVLNSDIKKIIIDLRNNPGGYLDEAIIVAGWFIEKGEVVTWQDTREEEKTPYKSNGPAVFKDYDVVVLINEGSASGSEILAGALRDVNQVKLIGKQSFGKGSVQEQISLSDNSSLKVTIAKWLTPDLISINEEGLIPDIEIDLEEEGDTQLDRAVEFLKDFN